VSTCTDRPTLIILATQQAFFEAPEKAFEFFGGVFRRLPN